MQLKPAIEPLPLVLLHAFPLDARMWREQVRDLAQQGITVHTPNVRGFGGEPIPDDSPQWTIGLFALDLLQYFDRVAIDRAVLGGCSMGGYLAFEFWRRYPARVAGLVLCDTRAEADSDAARENRRRMILKLEQEGTGFLKNFAVDNLVGRTTRKNNPELVREIGEWAAQAPKEAVVRTLGALAMRPDSSDTLATINVPVLLIFGEEDTVTPPLCGERMLKEIPAARMLTVAGAGHLSPLESPARVNPVLAEFVRSCAPQNS